MRCLRHAAVAALFPVAQLCLAGTGLAPFAVSVQFNPAGQTSATCSRSDSSGAFGADVTVVCRTGRLVDLSHANPYASSHGGAYRYLIRVVRDDFVLGTVDADIASGTIAQWRVIDSPDRSYVEMGVAW